MKRQKEVAHIDEKNQEKTYLSIRKYIINAQNKVKSAVNYAMVNAYWEIGKQIYLACGESERAAYGKQLLQYISEKLTVEFGKGFDVTNLRNMRRFYLMFPIRETLSPELSWSHYIKLMRVADKKAREFYEKEAVKAGWSVRQLERQINTMFYQRILASQDKESVAKEIELLEPKSEYETIIKDPYVLEFLNLPANEHFYESDLEQALIDHLQKFLLELGRGFSYTRELMNEGDNPPIGILLCADKSDTLVRYTLPEDNKQIYAAKYLPYMPTEEELRRELNLEDFKKRD